MTALADIRAKRTRREPLTAIEEIIWEYYWDYPTNRKEKAEQAAEGLASLMASLEIYHATLRKTEVQSAAKDAALAAARDGLNIVCKYSEPDENGYSPSLTELEADHIYRMASKARAALQESEKE